MKREDHTLPDQAAQVAGANAPIEKEIRRKELGSPEAACAGEVPPAASVFENIL